MPNIKTLFVYTNPLRIPYLDFGIVSLSAFLKKKGYQTALLDFTFGLNTAKAVQMLQAYKPDIVAFSSRSGEFPEVVKIAGLLRSRHAAVYICGGIHPTIAPEEAIRCDCFDGIAIGEGEASLYELVRRLESGQPYQTTPGFWFRHSGDIVKNPLNILIEQLDTLPLIDYELFDMTTYLAVRCGQLDYVSARGCPFVCTYCVNHTLMGIYQGLGRYSRCKSADTVIAELQQVRTQYPGVRSLKIADEHFLLDKNRLRLLAQRYPSEVGLPFECDARADFCDDEALQLLKAMGCDKLNIAIESGDEQLRSELLQKKISDEQLVNAFALARRYGIHTMSFNMIGLPFETREQIEKTVTLNKKAEPDSIQVSIFTPFKGTALYEFAKKNNLLISDDVARSYYTPENYLRNPFLSQRELGSLYRWFSYRCYRQRSWLKAVTLLLRDWLMPYFVTYGRYMPLWMKKGIYCLFWNLKALKFVSK